MALLATDSFPNVNAQSKLRGTLASVESRTKGGTNARGDIGVSGVGSSKDVDDVLKTMGWEFRFGGEHFGRNAAKRGRRA